MSWWREYRRRWQERKFRAELRRLRIAAITFKVELHDAYMRAAELMEANECGALATALRNDATKILRTDDF